MASCPESLIAEGLWSTSTPDWSSSVVYVVPKFTLRNDAGGDVDFSALSMAETIDVWIPGPSEEEEVYGLRDRGVFVVQRRPGGTSIQCWRVHHLGVCRDADAPASYPKKLSLRPEEGSVYGQFNYTMQSRIYERPILALIDAAEAQLTRFNSPRTQDYHALMRRRRHIYSASSANGSRWLMIEPAGLHLHGDRH